MNTLALICSIFGFWLTLSLPFKVYKTRTFAEYASIKIAWLRIRDMAALYLLGAISVYLAMAIFSDIYDLSLDGSKKLNPKETPKLLALASTIWLVLIIAFYYVVMRKYVPKEIVKKKKSKKGKKKSKLSKSDKRDKKFIRVNIIITIILFIVTSIGEGFFQDLLYEPIIKPMMCNIFEQLC